MSIGSFVAFMTVIGFGLSVAVMTIVMLKAFVACRDSRGETASGGI